MTTKHTIINGDCRQMSELGDKSAHLIITSPPYWQLKDYGADNQVHWYFNGAKQDKHLAMFPEELPHRLIKMFSFPNEIVLDPFLGCGTTSLAAKNLNRNSVGYEINADFIPIIKEKVGNVEVITQNLTGFKNLLGLDLISLLPYLFVDTHKIDKKIDVKKLQFGSKLDSNSAKREEYFTVKEIISPELLKLNNDLIIRLIGIKQNPQINGKATEYLKNKLRGKRVFLKYDEQKYDSQNNLMVYLYLENKTFVNAHLLKEKLADVDDAVDFKYKSKFLEI
jgi:site-specific DNA-methyltransferase (adenine-specific)